MSRFLALLFFGCWVGTVIYGGEIIRRYEARALEQHQALVEERQRNTVLDLALDIITRTPKSPKGNKFKKADAIWEAKEELTRASR